MPTNSSPPPNEEQVNPRLIAVGILNLVLAAYVFWATFTDHRDTTWVVASVLCRLLSLLLLWKLAPRQAIQDAVREVVHKTVVAVAAVAERTLTASELRRARIKRAGGRCPARSRRQRWELYGNLCWVCHAPATHSDHVIAIARGGGDWPANIRPACRRCNCSKGAGDWRITRSRALGLPSPGRLP